MEKQYFEIGRTYINIDECAGKFHSSVYGGGHWIPKEVKVLEKIGSRYYRGVTERSEVVTFDNDDKKFLIEKEIC